MTPLVQARSIESSVISTNPPIPEGFTKVTYLFPGRRSSSKDIAERNLTQLARQAPRGSYGFSLRRRVTEDTGTKKVENSLTYIINGQIVTKANILKRDIPKDKLDQLPFDNSKVIVRDRFGKTHIIKPEKARLVFTDPTPQDGRPRKAA